MIDDPHSTGQSRPGAADRSDRRIAIAVALVLHGALLWWLVRAGMGGPAEVRDGPAVTIDAEEARIGGMATAQIVSIDCAYLVEGTTARVVVPESDIARLPGGIGCPAELSMPDAPRIELESLPLFVSIGLRPDGSQESVETRSRNPDPAIRAAIRRTSTGWVLAVPRPGRTLPANLFFNIRFD